MEQAAGPRKRKERGSGEGRRGRWSNGGEEVRGMGKSPERIKRTPQRE